MTDPPDDGLAPGATLGRYQLIARLGAGAMGTVWKALQLGLNRPVALKLLRREHAGVAPIRARFLREGEAAARIRHPNVVVVHDVGEHDGIPYLAMEHLDGESLADKIDREGPSPPAEAVAILLPVVAAVSAAHEEGVIHRDLKPENIFLARHRDGSLLPKVLDFGISRVVDDRSGRVQTLNDTILGTPQYMAPEQARGERDIDDRSDQYALGALLYELTTGAMPFGDLPIHALLGRVMNGSFPPPRQRRPELSPALEGVILRAMALDRGARFRSLKSFGAALLPFADDATRTAWAGTFDPRAPGPGDATLVDEQPAPRAWQAHRPPQRASVDDGATTLKEGDRAAPRPEAATLVVERKPRRRGRIVLLAAVGVVLVATVVVVVALAVMR